MDVQIDEKIKQKILEPALYKVVFLNDDQTPMEFVIECLVGIFKHTETTALARTNGFPLQVKVEKE